MHHDVLDPTLSKVAVVHFAKYVWTKRSEDWKFAVDEKDFYGSTLTSFILSKTSEPSKSISLRVPGVANESTVLHRLHVVKTVDVAVPVEETKRTVSDATPGHTVS